MTVKLTVVRAVSPANSGCRTVAILSASALSVGYFQTYIMKGMAHGSWNDATYSDGSFGMDRWLVNVKQDASQARRLAALEKKVGITGFRRVSGRLVNGLIS